MDIIKSIEHEQLKNKIPDLKVGDTVRVHQRIKEVHPNGTNPAGNLVVVRKCVSLSAV